MSDKLLPWQEDSWRALHARRRGGRLPHALLLTGPTGIGKTRFTEQWLRALLCERPRNDDLACGDCRACRLLAAGNHPDYRWVAPLEEATAIVVDQMRELIHYVALTPQYGEHKLVAIAPADKMNINAANSLLKTLEEPPRHSLIILLTAQPGRLPATVRSRCQRIHFTPPPIGQAASWLGPRLAATDDPELLLKLADGAPLRALALAEAGVLQGRGELLSLVERLACGETETVAAAQAALKLGVHETLYCLHSWTCDMVRLTAGAAGARLVNLDISERLRALAEGIDPRVLFGQVDQITQALQLADRPLNPQLLLEDALSSWRGAVGRALG